MSSQFWHDDITITRNSISRRSFLYGVSAASAMGAFHFRDLVSAQANDLRKRHKAMILLFMVGGPSQFETFDPKPGTESGGATKSIGTAVPGIQIAEGWEKTAAQMKDIAIIRSLTNKEGQHDRAVYQLHTGYVPVASLKHPTLGCNIARELSPKDRDLPAVVSIGADRFVGATGLGSGFLGVDYEPFHVANPGTMPDNVATAVPVPRYQRRLGLLDKLENEFASKGGEVVVANHRRITEKSSKLALSPMTKSFDFSDESAETRKLYGETPFGRGCLLARRMVESGVTCVEVRFGNWDTHQDNFSTIKGLAAECDPAVAGLISDLKQRGMLDDTLILWTGEFGRTPRINPRDGRDHWPRNFNALVAGGGIKGGQVIGETSKDGTSLLKDQVTVPDLFSSICRSLGVDAAKSNMSPIGRPMKIVDGGNPVEALFS